MSTLEDARYRTKVWLETYINSNNLLEDDGITKAKFIVAYAEPDYPLIRVFYDKYVDVVFAIGEPNATPMLESNLNVWGYDEHVPVFTFCIEKIGITGEKLKWKANRELRRVCEDNPYGSIRILQNQTDNDTTLGSTKIYSTKTILGYKRRKTG